MRTRRSFPNCRLYREDSQASDDGGGIALRIRDVVPFVNGINSLISAGIPSFLLESSDGDDGHVSYGRRRRQCGMMPSGCHPSIAVLEQRIGFCGR